MSFSEHRAKFSKDKEILNPNFKPQTNIPVNILMVKSVLAKTEKNETGDEYAVMDLVCDVEYPDGIRTKTWAISSETLVDTLESKGVDIGSSFTVLKKGEGFQTKYEITNVKNKE